MGVALRKKYSFLCTVDEAITIFKGGYADIVVLSSEDDGSINSTAHLVTLTRVNGINDLVVIDKDVKFFTDETETQIKAITGLEVELVGK